MQRPAATRRLTLSLSLSVSLFYALVFALLKDTKRGDRKGKRLKGRDQTKDSYTGSGWKPLDGSAPCPSFQYRRHLRLTSGTGMRGIKLHPSSFVAGLPITALAGSPRWRGNRRARMPETQRCLRRQKRTASGNNMCFCVGIRFRDFEPSVEDDLHFFAFFRAIRRH